MVIPVIFSILLACAAFYLACADAWYVLTHLAAFGSDDSATNSSLRTQLVTKIIKVIDIYLVAAFLIIFAFGLYELFIGKLHLGEGSENAPRLLVIQSLDDLKTRLAQVALLVLVTEFLQVAINMTFERPLDLLYLGLGIFLVGGAIYLSSRSGHEETH